MSQNEDIKILINDQMLWGDNPFLNAVVDIEEFQKVQLDLEEEPDKILDTIEIIEEEDGSTDNPGDIS